ncbi:DUF488 domain-containing protein [Brevibacillus fulvus]|uniref:Uncharacterized protein YeaO (DUF488 family) n=1 Tax=Brevibacillus fulvus TaxID=1125967 RepID=A0A938XRM2_9BACL|nr:DUF488 domain-containing protein [Brevibacillus fulvus]MBM7588998.1 uncharacterized protein YeaO (DUF488 family) [Brevibacillus fulvus]
MDESNCSAIQIKRIYEPHSAEDGVRILVDRLWPRGISKKKAFIAEWMKEIAPSPELRKSFCHQPELFSAFSAQYERELAEDPTRCALVRHICEIAKENTVTLLTATKDPVYNHAVVLQRWLERHCI